MPRATRRPCAERAFLKELGGSCQTPYRRVCVDSITSGETHLEGARYLD